MPKLVYGCFLLRKCQNQLKKKEVPKIKAGTKNDSSLNSFANNFDAQTQKLSTFVLCVCTLCPLYRPKQGNIVGREYIHITQKLTIFGSGRQSCLGQMRAKYHFDIEMPIRGTG
jgi:hypothetical protein